MVVVHPLEHEDVELVQVKGKQVTYAWVLPLTTAELELKPAQGSALFQALADADLDPVCDAFRRCAVTGQAPAR